MSTRDTRAKASLTEGERTVLRLVAEGMTDQEIAATLGLECSSIQTYCRRLCRKVGCKNRAQLTRYAVACGLVPAA